MGKRKGRKEAKEAQIPAADQIAKNGEQQEEKGPGFFACYLLTSLCPRFKSHTYIGYTVNPRRRIRQHNGEIGSGAWRTKRKRPWEMVLCIYGFPTNVAALQFEWAWQHPVESLALRKAAASFKSLSGLANKIKLAYTMLTLPPWQSLNLTVNLFSTKYRQHTSACPALPEQMQTQVCSMDELPCYNADVCINDECDDIVNDCSFRGSKDKESTRAVRDEGVHNSPSYDHISEENFNQQINHTDGASLESRRWVSSLTREEDEVRFCISNDSPARTLFSSSSSYIAEESPGFVEFTTVSDESLDKQPEKDRYRVLITSPDISGHDVEIIDPFTPSPCKKRRPNLCPEVIDLTNSPIFV